jgi:hypothetical protein
MTDDVFTEEQPVLLGRGGPRFPVWCRAHGAWLLDERAIAEKVREAKMYRRKMKYGSSPTD